MRSLEDFSEENRFLVAVLRNPDASVRLRALEEAVDEADDELTEELMRLLEEDPSEEVRARVPIALGPTLELCYSEVDDEGRLPPPSDWNINPLTQEVYDRLLETLRRLYLAAATPELVRRRVLEGAVRSPRPWQEKATAAAFRSEEEPWRITAVFCMGHLRGFEGEIAEAFGSGSEAVRYEAIRAAGLRGAERLARPLLRLAKDPEADVDERVAATLALPVLGPPGAFEALDELCADPEEAVDEAAEEALGELSMMTMGEEALGDDWDEL